MTPDVRGVFLGLFVALVAASAVGAWLARSRPSSVVDNLNARIRAWWVMIAAGGVALLLGRPAVILLFAALSWFALAEFSPKGWHFLAVPAQFLAIFFSATTVALFLVPLLCLFARERLGLLLCVYGLSFIPQLPRLEWMLYLVLIVQASDVLQYIWGRLLGRRPVAPRLSPAKTVEGLLGGVGTATAIGAMLYYLTPFSPAQSALVSLAVAMAGFVSGLAFSAVKRQRRLKDWGSAISGHGGVLDRIDSLCLSAPLFFLLTKAHAQ
jgi:phosphatidate cytidylyltransferase